MQLVIDISEGLKFALEQEELWQNQQESAQTLCQGMKKVLDNAVVLPEGHGRIVDGDIILWWLINKDVIAKLKCGETAEIFKKATIVEADEKRRQTS